MKLSIMAASIAAILGSTSHAAAICKVTGGFVVPAGETVAFTCITDSIVVQEKASKKLHDAVFTTQKGDSLERILGKKEAQKAAKDMQLKVEPARVTGQKAFVKLPVGCTFKRVNGVYHKVKSCN